MRTPRPNLAALLVLGALAAAALLASESSRSSENVAVKAPAASSWRGLVGAPRVPIAVGQRVLVILKAPSLAAHVAAAGGFASDADERRWTAAALAGQQQFLSDIAAKGVRIKPELRFTRVVNGFSAAIDPSAIALLERAPEVQGVYPVRAAYPAAISRSRLPADFFRSGTGHRPDVSLGAFTGVGVTVALLDTGVDPATPYLHGHVLDGLDVVGEAPDARVQANPDDRRRLERHGTEMAGLVVGADGPGGLAGAAGGATLLPIRVAGWQKDATGGYAVYARTDQILAGLELAVDPNRDGDAHDAARVALVPLAEPYGAFADDPLARAAAGALRLDTLMVVPAGNDGPAGPSFGSLSGPGGAPAALTVGAADLRPRAEEVQLVLRTGLRVLVNRRVPLAGAFGPARHLDLELAAPRRVLGTTGFSLVAGKAALLSAAGGPAAPVESAAAAGAALVILHGDGLPAGSLGLDEAAPVPILTIPEGPANAALAALKAGQTVHVAVSPVRRRDNGSAGRVAAFSSWGFGFGADLKPELVAPGVAVTTADPGGGPLSDFVSVNGSSGSAAIVAGAAALLLQARPSLDAAALKSLLVGSARPLAGEPLQAQGAGVVDVAAAAGLELATEPAALTFGRAHGDGWQRARKLVVRNLSPRRLTLYVSTGQGRNRRLVLAVLPRRLVVPAGQSRTVIVTARLAAAAQGNVAAGELELTPVGGAPLRVPWSAVLGPTPTGLVGSVQLSARSFAPSESSPAVLALRVGRVLHLASGDAIQPVLRLDLVLLDGKGKAMGLLVRERDLLPGRYAFGLTGRGPGGSLLKPGAYQLRLLAWPTTGGLPTIASVSFEITKKGAG